MKGSSAYVPPDPKDDKQLNYALDLLQRQAGEHRLPARSESRHTELSRAGGAACRCRLSSLMAG